MLTSGERAWLYNDGSGRSYNNLTSMPPEAIYTYDDPDHIHAVTAFGTTGSYSYDANGNMKLRVEDGVTYTQGFDAENRLISVNVSGQPLPALFIYDGDGNLVKQIKPDGSKTLYVGGVYEVNKNSSGSVTGTKTYYPAAGAMRDGSTLYYILKDHLGSASAVTDASGAVVAGTQMRYLPFGEERFATGPMVTDKLFTGQRQIAELGIYHYGARFYSPYINRFLSADTIVPGYANPQNLNRYSYVTNNPLRYTDPTGHRPDDGCRTTGCSLSQYQKEQDEQKLQLLKKDRDKRKCKAGDENYCPTIQTHPVEVVGFTLAGLALAGIGATSVGYMSTVEAAAVINAGINVTADCITTSIGGGNCSARNALITAGFSLVTGGVRGSVTSLFSLETPESFAGMVITNAAIQLGSNTMQRSIKGETTGKKAYLDWGSGAATAVIQMMPGDVYAVSHLAEAVSGIFEAIGTLNSNP